jgi:Bacterial PH domain
MSLPELPITYRPKWGRIVPYSLAVVVLALCTILAIVLPGGTHGFRPVDRLGVFGVGVLSAAFLCVLARPHVIARPTGLRVVNLFRARNLEWAEVIEVNLRSGDPWVLLDLSDGDTLAAMGIQANDGVRAQRAAHELRRLVAVHTVTDRDD